MLMLLSIMMAMSFCFMVAFRKNPIYLHPAPVPRDLPGKWQIHEKMDNHHRGGKRRDIINLSRPCKAFS
jgi:hypothetical protein